MPGKSRRAGIKARTIPDSNHVLRYCRPSHVKMESVKAGAFDLRSGEEFLSVNWMEFFEDAASTYAQVAAVRKIMAKKFMLAPNGRFARLNVGEVKERINGARVRHFPGKDDPSHAGISVRGEQNREFSLELANLVKPNDVFPAVPPE